jgi:hypothetical protein
MVNVPNENYSNSTTNNIINNVNEVYTVVNNTSEVYTIDDMRALYNNYNMEMRNLHIDSAVHHIKRRILDAVRVGLESHMVRRIVPLEEWQSFARRGVVKGNGLLENESIAAECIGDILIQLRVMFPDTHLHFNAVDNVLFIGWML